MGFFFFFNLRASHLHMISLFLNPVFMTFSSLCLWSEGSILLLKTTMAKKKTKWKEDRKRKKIKERKKSSPANSSGLFFSAIWLQKLPLIILPEELHSMILLLNLVIWLFPTSICRVYKCYICSLNFISESWVEMNYPRENIVSSWFIKKVWVPCLGR